MTPTRSSRPRPTLGLSWGLVSLGVVFLLAAPGHAQVLGNAWDEEGPSPILLGQAEGLPGPNPVVGAINSVAAHPTDPDILYIGAVNGGIWRTLDGTSVAPTWQRLTESEASLAIGTIEFDPTDATNSTLLAGIGRFSSYASVGGNRSGLLRTTDGVNFTQIDGGMAGRNIVGVAPRASTLVAAVDTFSSFTCSQLGIFRSTNTGASWTQILSGRADALASDPNSPSTLYASLTSATAGLCGSGNGIHKSTDTGATWAKVSNAAMDSLFFNGSAMNVDIAVGATGSVFVAMVPGTGAYGGVFQSTDGGATWSTMDLPSHPAGILHEGGQGSIHTSIAADPTDPDVVYLGGDRQDSPFPNAIGAFNFSGNLARGDAGLPSGSQWTELTHSGTASNSSPHADSRDMIFDADGNLIETDDGGIYRRTSPASTAGDWFSINSNLQVTEDHGMAYDSLNDRLLVGNQDTGSAWQTSTSGPVWSQISQGDGGDVLSGPGAAAGTEDRYSSFQNLGVFRRRVFNSSDTLISTFALGPYGGLAPQFSTPLGINATDSSRIIIGAGNGVFESTNRGATVSSVPGGAIVANSFDGAGAIAAGGIGNADLLYVAADSGPSGAGLYRRTTGGGSLTLAQVAAAGQFMVGATIDPDVSARGFGLDTANVYWTTNSGASFTNVTGNLLTLSPGLLRSIEYINRASGDAVVVGADRGVYVASPPGSTTWTKFGAGLPNSPVFELTYDTTADDLFAGLFGGGVYRMRSLSDACGMSEVLPFGVVGGGGWQQISLPCDPGGSDTVSDVISDDLDGTYGTDWIMYRRDESTTSYVALTETDSLTVGEGYWIKTLRPTQSIGMSGAANTLTDIPLTGVVAAPPAGCASSAGQCNKVGHPHNFDVCWADVLVDDGGPISLAAADPAGICQTTGGATCIMSRIAHKWTGASYAPFDGTTPGMEGTLVAWDGFWVSANKAGIDLRIPATPGGPGLPCGPPAFGEGDDAGGWYVRLIAESGDLVDRDNVLGELPDSADGYDSHDLQELDPFGDAYLTIVFPQNDWGALAGNYASDYRSLGTHRARLWRFQVRSSDEAADVVLRWEGPAAQLERATLIDVDSGTELLPAVEGSYSFTMQGVERNFAWVVR